MADRQIVVDGQPHVFPSTFSDDDINNALQQYDQEKGGGATAAPRNPVTPQGDRLAYNRHTHEAMTVNNNPPADTPPADSPRVSMLKRAFKPMVDQVKDISQPNMSTLTRLRKGLNEAPMWHTAGNLVHEGAESVEGLINQQEEKAPDSTLVKVAAGGGRAGAKFLDTMAQPENIATAGAFEGAGSIPGAVGKLVRVGTGLKFGLPMLKHAVESGAQSAEDFMSGDVGAGTEHAVDATLGGLAGAETTGGAARDMVPAAKTIAGKVLYPGADTMNKTPTGRGKLNPTEAYTPTEIMQHAEDPAQGAKVEMTPAEITESGGLRAIQGIGQKSLVGKDNLQRHQADAQSAVIDRTQEQLKRLSPNTPNTISIARDLKNQVGRIEAAERVDKPGKDATDDERVAYEAYKKKWGKGADSALADIHNAKETDLVKLPGQLLEKATGGNPVHIDQLREHGVDLSGLQREVVQRALDSGFRTPQNKLGGFEDDFLQSLFADNPHELDALYKNARIGKSVGVDFNPSNTAGALNARGEFEAGLNMAKEAASLNPKGILSEAIDALPGYAASKLSTSSGFKRWQTRVPESRFGKWLLNKQGSGRGPKPTPPAAGPSTPPDNSGGGPGGSPQGKPGAGGPGDSTTGEVGASKKLEMTPERREAASRTTREKVDTLNMQIKAAQTDGRTELVKQYTQMRDDLINQNRTAAEAHADDNAQVGAKAKLVKNNGSGQGAGDSLEAQSRVASMNKSGAKYVRIDTRSGNETPIMQDVNNVDVAQRGGPYDRVVKRYADGTEETQFEGAKARPVGKKPQQTVGQGSAKLVKGVGRADVLDDQGVKQELQDKLDAEGEAADKIKSQKFAAGNSVKIGKTTQKMYKDTAVIPGEPAEPARSVGAAALKKKSGTPEDEPVLTNRMKSPIPSTNRFEDDGMEVSLRRFWRDQERSLGYDPGTFAETEDLEDIIDPQHISPKGIKSGQEHVHKDVGNNPPYDENHPINVAKMGDRLQLLDDGNHRTAAALLNNRPLNARIWDLGNKHFIDDVRDDQGVKQDIEKKPGTGSVADILKKKKK